MADNREAKFLDALYLGAKDGGLFDRAMGMLARSVRLRLGLLASPDDFI
jgi:hypothetical protein